VKADFEQSSDQGTAPAPGELERSAARCRAIAGQIRDSLVQELTAEALNLEVAGLGGVADAEREALQARARLLERCARLLGAVAEQLESIAE